MSNKKPPDPPDIYPDLNDSVPDASTFMEVSTQPAEVSFISRKRPKTSSDPPLSPPITPITSNPNTKMNVPRNLYKASDYPPYIVHTSIVEDSPASGIVLHPIKFGQILMQNNSFLVKQGGIKKIGRNKLAIEFKTFGDANSFLTNKEFLNKHNLTAIIPQYNITRMGLVRGIPSDWSNEEIIANIRVPTPCGEIIKARRLNRKVSINGETTWKPTESVVLTFDGQYFPNRVYCCLSSLPVLPYQFPTIQCYACCRFGHTKVKCRSKPRCFKCARDHHGDTCNVPLEDASCIHCAGNHFAYNKQCPEYIRQNNIKSRMTSENISYLEASKKTPSFAKSFSNTVSSYPKPIQSSLTQSSPIQSHSQSYKKTVTLKKKNPPSFSTGYNQKAHLDLLNSFAIPSSPNGYALASSAPPATADMISSLFSTLNSLIENYSNNLPSHVASSLTTSLSLLNNIINKNYENKGPPMEHQEYK